MGKGGGVEGPTNLGQAPLNIPNEQQLQAAAVGRTLAAAPWTANPWRPMDYLFGLPAPMMQVPQFQPMAGQSMFSSGRQDPLMQAGQMSGGYSQGMPGYQMPFWPLPFLNPQALTYAMAQMPPVGQMQQQMPQQGQQPQQSQGQSNSNNSGGG